MFSKLCLHIKYCNEGFDTPPIEMIAFFFGGPGEKYFASDFTVEGKNTLACGFKVPVKGSTEGQ